MHINHSHKHGVDMRSLVKEVQQGMESFKAVFGGLPPPRRSPSSLLFGS